MRTLYLSLFCLLLAGCSSNEKIPSNYSLPSIADPSFYRTISGLTGMPLLPGNRVKILNSNEATFSHLNDILRSAHKTINIEIYIFSSDRTGSEVAKILIERAQAGVKVKLLVDYFGGRNLKRSMVKKFKNAGIEFHFHEPFNILKPRKFNERTHRKLIIVDGRIGMTGGFGISDFWTNNDPKEKVRDLQVLAEGPVVSQMQSIFMRNWYKATGNIFIGDDYFPSIEAAKGVKSRMVSSKPRNGSSALKHTFLLAINSATRYFWMEQSYFAPDQLMIDSLISAARRGVDVRLILPSIDATDITPVTHAGRKYYDELIAGGVKIYEFRTGYLHSKFALADDIWVTIGSSNFDTRSFYLSSEANIEIYDKNFSEKVKKIFIEDQNICHMLRLNTFRERSWALKFKEWFFGIMINQL